MSSKILPRDFYARSVIDVAKDLVGMRLVRIFDSKRISGIILETEAYDGENDLACHARLGKTKRNAVMFGDPGHAYVYFTYGMHWCLNCVTGPQGYPAAVLIRTIQPIEGISFIVTNRPGAKEKDWCNGPAKLTRALSIDGNFNDTDLCDKKNNLLIEKGIQITQQSIISSSRIGIGSVPEPWRSKAWNFKIAMPENS